MLPPPKCSLFIMLCARNGGFCAEELFPSLLRFHWVMAWRRVAVATAGVVVCAVGLPSVPTPPMGWMSVGGLHVRPDCFRGSPSGSFRAPASPRCVVGSLHARRCGPRACAMTPMRMQWEVFRCQTNCTAYPTACINQDLYMAQTVGSLFLCATWPSSASAFGVPTA